MGHLQGQAKCPGEGVAVPDDKGTRSLLFQYDNRCKTEEMVELYLCKILYVKLLSECEFASIKIPK